MQVKCLEQCPAHSKPSTNASCSDHVTHRIAINLKHCSGNKGRGEGKKKEEKEGRGYVFFPTQGQALMESVYKTKCPLESSRNVTVFVPQLGNHRGWERLR